MCQPPENKAIRAVLATAKVDSSLDKVVRLPSSKPQRPYDLQLADGRRLRLVMAPPSRMRLLRCEQRSTSTEAAVIHWLAETLAHDGNRPGPAYDKQPRARSDTAAGPSETSTPGVDLAAAVPSLVAQSRGSDELGAPYNIFDAPRGTPVRFLEAPITHSERAVVDYEAGSLMRRLAALTPTPARFGPALPVLSPSQSSPSSSRRPRPVTHQEGQSSWSTAFHSLLEGALRDGEDMAVVLPYTAIRRNFKRLSYLLDMVTTPRLVVPDAADDDNLLVTRPSTAPTEPSSSTEEDKEDEEDKKKSPKHPLPAPITVTGIRDWSQAVFGDPLFASVFCDEPSADLYRGFDDEAVASSDDLIDDREMAPIRILLYRCYHLVVAIAMEFHRPTSQGSVREMAARRKLGETLMKLGEVEDTPKRRHHRRPSGEMSPAKKLRSETPEESRGGGGKRESVAEGGSKGKEKE